MRIAVAAAAVALFAGSAGAQPTNPIMIENQRAGSAGWDISQPALHREIEGYASKTSINSGEPIDLFVNTTAGSYTIDVFRTGWYAGTGARRVAGPIDRRGIVQEIPEPDAS